MRDLPGSQGSGGVQFGARLTFTQRPSEAECVRCGSCWALPPLGKRDTISHSLGACAGISDDRGYGASGPEARVRGRCALI